MLNLEDSEAPIQNSFFPFEAQEMTDSRKTNFDSTGDFGAISVVAAVARLLPAMAFADIAVEA